MRYFVLVAILSLMNLLTAYGRQKDTVVLTPGHAVLSNVKLKPGKSSYVFTLTKDGTTKQVGGLKEELVKLPWQGQPHYLRVCHIKFGNNSILDSGLAELSTLAPVYHRSYQTNKQMLFDFAGTVITGSVNSMDSMGQRSNPVHHSVTHRLFDSYYEDIIARTLPFDNGFVFKFPEYIYERGGLVWSTGKVIANGKHEVEDTLAMRTAEVHFYEHDDKGAVTRETIYVIDIDDRSIQSREYIMGTTRILMSPKRAVPGA